MRVPDPNLTGAAPGGTTPTRESQRVEREDPAGTPAARTGPGADHVELSTLSRALHASEAARSQRIAHLAREYQEGRYTVDSARLAHALVEETLQASKGKP